MGADTYLEREKSLSVALKNISLGKKIVYRLLDLLSLSICIILFSILLTSSSFLMNVARSVVLGLILYFIARVRFNA